MPVQAWVSALRCWSHIQFRNHCGAVCVWHCRTQVDIRSAPGAISNQAITVVTSFTRAAPARRSPLCGVTVHRIEKRRQSSTSSERCSPSSLPIALPSKSHPTSHFTSYCTSHDHDHQQQFQFRPVNSNALRPEQRDTSSDRQQLRSGQSTQHEYYCRMRSQTSHVILTISAESKRIN